jgi:hypothetical protein
MIAAIKSNKGLLANDICKDKVKSNDFRAVLVKNAQSGRNF